MIGVEIESLDMAVEEGSHGTQKLGYTIDWLCIKEEGHKVTAMSIKEHSSYKI